MKINVFRTAITLDHADDEGVEGIYEVTFDEDYPDVSDAKMASMALDLFATKIGIECLDDFTITALNDNDEPVDEDETHESYSFDGKGDVEKTSDVAIDLYDDDADLTTEQLDCKYNPDGDGQHPTVTRSSWEEAVRSKQTSSDYWSWVKYILVTKAEKEASGE